MSDISKPVEDLAVVLQCTPLQAANLLGRMHIDVSDDDHFNPNEFTSFMQRAAALKEARAIPPIPPVMPPGPYYPSNEEKDSLRRTFIQTFLNRGATRSKPYRRKSKIIVFNLPSSDDVIRVSTWTTGYVSQHPLDAAFQVHPLPCDWYAFLSIQLRRVFMCSALDIDNHFSLKEKPTKSSTLHFFEEDDSFDKSITTIFSSTTGV